MNVTTDNGEYDGIQAYFCFELCKAIRADLEEGGVEGEKLKELVGKIGFSIASILDGARAIDEKAGSPIILYKARKDSEKVLTHESGSFLHEYVFGNIDELFQD